VVVTAENGVTSKTYTITVTRADSGGGNTTASVEAPVAGAFFDPAAEIMSGTASDPDGDTIAYVKIAIQDALGNYFNNNGGYWASGEYWMDTVGVQNYLSWSLNLSTYADLFNPGEYSISIKANDGADHIISNASSFMVEGMVLSQCQHSFSGDVAQVNIDVYSPGIQDNLLVEFIKNELTVECLPVGDGINCQNWAANRAEGIVLNIAGGNPPGEYSIKATAGEYCYSSYYDISPGWARKRGDLTLAGVDTSTSIDSEYYTYGDEDYLCVAYRDPGDKSGKYSVMNMTYADTWSDGGTFASNVGQLSMYWPYYEVPEPYIAYTDSASSAGYIAYNNGSWQTLPGGSFGNVGSDLDIFKDSSSYYSDLLIAYSDAGNSDKGTAKKYSDGSWLEYPLFSAGGASQISWDESGWYLGCIDAGSGNKAIIKELEEDQYGMKWQDAGNTTGGAISLDAAEYFSLAGCCCTSYVAYKDLGASGKATVMAKNMEDGDGWGLLGSRGFTPGAADHLQVEALNIEGNETPFVIFSDGNAEGKATVMKYNLMDEAWEPLGNTGFSDNAITYGRLFHDYETSAVYAMYAENNEIKLRKYVTELCPLEEPSVYLEGSMFGWYPVYDAVGYRVRVYGAGGVIETEVLETETCQYSLSHLSAGNGPYSITVQALGDLWNNCDGPESGVEYQGTDTL
jgi:hypothetical protein